MLELEYKIAPIEYKPPERSKKDEGRWDEQ